MASASEVRGNAPDRVDLRDALWPVEHVGPLMASAASAATAALEYHCNRLDRDPTNLSTLFVHYNARAAAGRHGANSGTTMEAVFQAIAMRGACREETWPLDPSALALRPPDAAYDEARSFASVSWLHPADPVEALALRYPVPAVVKVTTAALETAGRSGALPDIAASRVADEDVINHALLLVGYDRSRRVFMARNCWGTEWGDQGHCTIGFDTLSAIAPAGSTRLWAIVSPHRAAAETSSSPSAPRESVPADRLSDLATRLRDDIRGSLRRDLDDATRRIRESLGRPGRGDA